MKVQILDCAEEDLQNGRDFYEKQGEGLGEYFLDSLSADIDSLPYFAGIHRKVGRYHKALAHTFPYAIYYMIDEGLVKVWAILDCRQDPAWVRRQLRSRF